MSRFFPGATSFKSSSSVRLENILLALSTTSRQELIATCTDNLWDVICNKPLFRSLSILCAAPAVCHRPKAAPECIKFLWPAPNSRAHLDCPIQGRASAYGHIGPAPWSSAWQGARNRVNISAFLQGSQGYHRSQRAYARRSQRAAKASRFYPEQQSSLGASADRATLT